MFFQSCNFSSNKNEKEKTKKELDYEIADDYLEYDSEKIGLLSVIKNVPYQKANSVLRDYLAKTINYSDLSSENQNYIVNVIDTIARKNNLSRKLTASIIFSYKYEMITKDEYFEEKIDELRQEEYEERENYY
ncbi:hypothetical protein [Tenacibaculum finnmarkense]|uniref:hypothetical protein n=1 Tax=Tenacibaculum finnmarkense TaxID=2781243 RepID=UPI001EFB5068|nr:hypothetical protein [Tenacibaculum finnmarkense]